MATPLELTAAQFGEIVAGIERASGADKERDKRRAPRVERRMTMVITFVPGALADAAQKAVSVTVRDFSSRGIGMLVHHEVPKGAQFILQLRSQGKDPVSMLCTTAHCRRINSELFAVGAEYTCILPGGSTDRNDDAAERARISASILD